jgi:hypothetical protein
MHQPRPQTIDFTPSHNCLFYHITIQLQDCVNKIINQNMSVPRLLDQKTIASDQYTRIMQNFNKDQRVSTNKIRECLIEENKRKIMFRMKDKEFKKAKVILIFREVNFLLTSFELLQFIDPLHYFSPKMFYPLGT